MNDASPFGPETQKYWDLRLDLFSRFNDGVQLDREALFSIKPELVALSIAAQIRGVRVLDAFCGAGGSAIAFARKGKFVTAVESNIERIRMAEHNAGIYGVGGMIDFIHDDVRNVISSKSCLADIVYFDPPWGGPEYINASRFTLSMFSPRGEELLTLASVKKLDIAFTVPKNFDLTEFSFKSRKFTFEWNYLRERRLFGTAYINREDHDC